MNNMKTTLLLATLTAILVVLGDNDYGRSGKDDYVRYIHGHEFYVLLV